MTIWKPIPGYESVYDISDSGDVRRMLDRASGKRGRILKPFKTIYGYHQVTLTNKTQRKFYVHKLVMLAFVGESTLQVNHKNGDKTDNRTCNLEYVTHQQNAIHAKRVLRIGTGETHWNSTLTEKDIERIHQLYKNGSKQREIASRYGIGRPYVSQILSGKTWRHIHSKYA